MKIEALDEMLIETLEDGRLSRSEKRALRAVLQDVEPDAATSARYRNRAFEIARSALDGMPADEVLGWLEGVVKLLARPPEPARVAHRIRAEAAFSPGDTCRELIQRQLDGARRSIDICVFTITDDRVSRAITAAHRRGVDVRVISDDDKSLDRGSDVERLASAGIAVRMDRTDAHMHHKFALFDRKLLLTGSYNWTRSAATANHENIVLTDESRLVKAFAGCFDRLWSELG